MKIGTELTNEHFMEFEPIFNSWSIPSNERWNPRVRHSDYKSVLRRPREKACCSKTTYTDTADET
jgi:hypothetical protein